MNRAPWLLTAAIVAVAVLLRVAYVLAFRDHPLFDAPNMDAGYHLAWARSLAEGTEFQDGPFFRAPLYPLFLSWTLGIFGEGTLGPRLVQAVLGGLSTWLTIRIGQRTFGRGAGHVAGALVALSWVLVAFDAELLIPTLFVPLTLLALDRTLAWGLDDRWKLAGLAGLAFGLAAIARPNVLLFMPLLFGLSLLRSRGWRAPLALTLGTCLAVAPVTVHNVLEGDGTLVATQAGVNLWIGNNPQSDGTSAIVPGTPDGWWEGYYGAIAQAEAAEGRELAATEVSSHFTGRAFEWMGDAPGDALRHMGWKTWLLLSNVELANNSDVEFTARRTLRPLRFSPSRWDLLLGFGVVGLALGALRRRAGAGLLGLYALTYAGTIVLFFVSARFRVPLIPVLAVGAGHALVEIGVRARERRWRDAAAVLLPSLLLLGLSNVIPDRVDRGDTAGLLSLGLAELRRGDAEAALPHLEEAYGLSPTNPQVRFQLASALKQTGGSRRRMLGLVTVPEEARGNPAMLDLEVLRLELLLEESGPVTALPAIEQMLASYPGTSKLRFLRAAALAGAGRTDEALVALSEQARDEPQNPEPHYAAGQIFQQTGRPAEASAAFERVLEREAFCAPVVLQDVKARLANLGG